MKTLLLYSEDGCPWCTKMKGLLDENNIKFLVRDIDRYDKEWEKVSEEAKTEYIPTACIVDHQEKTKTYLTPDVDFEGGGTNYVKQNTVVRGKKGYAVLHPGRLTHYHEGLPITKCNRYILISFVE